MPTMTLEELTDATAALQEAVSELAQRDRGEILLCAMETPPTGCIPCDGALYNLTDPTNERLRKLFQKIGNRYGGDGVNTFGVPDLRGEFLRGWDNGKGVDAGRALGSSQTQATAMPTNRFDTTPAGGHNHGGNTGGESNAHNHNASASGGSAQGGPNTFDDGDRRGVNGTVSVSVGNNNQGHTHSIGAVGDHKHTVTGGDAETRPRNVALAAFIRF